MAQLTLADGRTLDFEVSGPSDGVPLLMHHGTPSGRVRFHAFEEAVHRRGLRLVTYSRPGYGSSTRQHGRRVADVAADVAVILDDLGVERCVTLGWSGGGPHVLATAALLPDRVAAATCVSGFAPYGVEGLDFLVGMGEDNIAEFTATLESEDAIQSMLGPAAEHLSAATPGEVVEALSPLLAPIDVTALEGRPSEDLAAILADALAVGAGGWIDDDLAFVGGWGFDPAAIEVPVFVWQGDLDLMVPFAHGRWLAERIPATKAHLLTGEGHISAFFGHVDEILDELAAAL